MSKYRGIDSREIKCCDNSETTIEAGISFDKNEGQNILNFHFLEYIDTKNSGEILHQETKSMWLNKENTNQLINILSELSFKNNNIMDREKIIADIERLQDETDAKGFKGTNEHNLYLRELIADYIVKR